MNQLTDDTPIVIFGDDWGRNVSTLQHVFAHLVTHHPVIWVNSFGHRAPRLTLYDLRRAAAKVRSMLSGYRLEEDGRARPARIIEPRAIPWHNLALIRALNTYSLLRDIRRALANVAPGRPPLLITGTPAAEGVVGRLGEIASLYFCMDDYAELPGVDRKVVAPLEEKLLGKIDAVVATAAALVEKKRPASGRAYALPQGVNYEHFATRQPVPADLAGLPRPWIGFAGGVGSACDFSIISALADLFPHGSIVMVGPIEPGIATPDRPNLHLFGHRPYDQLPAYVQAFDVGLIPYVLNDWTRAVDPLKLLEYLAAGIAVVSTAIPEVFKYEGEVRVATGLSEFSAAVRDTLARPATDSDAEARQSLARANTWRRRSEQLMSIVAAVVTDKTRAPE